MQWLKWLPAVTAWVVLAACQQKAETPVAQNPAPEANPTATQEAPELNVANWPDYIPEGTLQAFQKETGIRVHYSIFKNNEELQRSLETKPEQYDVVVPGSGWAKTQKESQLFQPLDKKRLPSLSNLDPAMLQRLSQVDPEHQYFVPWGSGYTTIAVNKTLLSRHLAPEDYPANAWDLVFDPKWARKVSACGLAYLDSPSEILPLVLFDMGKPPYSSNLEDYASARERLDKVRPHIRTFTTKMIDTLVSRRACVAIAWSGDIAAAQMQMADEGITDELVALFPSKGTLSFVDVAAIPAKAQHPLNAHRFLDYMMRVDNAKQFVEEVGYPNGNIKAFEQLPPEIQKHPISYPDSAFAQRLVPPDSFTIQARWEMLSNYLKFAYDAR